MSELRVAGLAVDLSYIVATRDEDGAPIWRGPVVLRAGGDVWIDAWLGAGLSQVELPEMSDMAVAGLEDAIAREFETRESPRGYREPLTRDEVWEIVAYDMAKEGWKVAA